MSTAIKMHRVRAAANGTPHEVNPLSGMLRPSVERGDRSLLALTVSVVVHLAIGASIAAASYMLVSPPPPVRTYLVPAPHLAPPAGGPPPLKGSPQGRRETRPPDAPKVPPKVTPAPAVNQVLSPPEAPSAAVVENIAVPFGSKTGSENGRWDGVEGGNNPDGPGVGPGVPDSFGPPGDEILVVPPSQAKLLKQVAPIYPRLQRTVGVPGLVVLDAIIDTDGRVEELTVLQATPGFEQSAMDAVRQWEFEPATVGGRKVRMRLTVTVRFALER